MTLRDCMIAILALAWAALCCLVGSAVAVNALLKVVANERNRA